MKQLPVYPSHPLLAVEETPSSDVNRSCELCGLSKGVRTVCMSPELEGDPALGTVLVLGQGPGETEDRHGRPNVGQSGTYLRQQMKLFWKGAVVHDNAVRCAPGARKVLPTQVAACRTYVAKTIDEAQPERILCLGTSAMQSIVGRSFPPFSVRKGYTYMGPTPVFFLMHPVNVLRNRFMRSWFEDDLEWALKAEPSPIPLDAAAFMIETVEEARQAVEDMEMAGRLTWDLETFGAPFNKEFRILNLAITPDGCDYAYVFENAALENPAIQNLIFPLLRSMPSGGQNVKFDCVGMRAKYKLKVDKIDFDTMIWRRILFSGAYAALENQQTLVGMAGAKDDIDDDRKAGNKELALLQKKPETVPKLFAEIPIDDLSRSLDRIKNGDDCNRYNFAAIPRVKRSLYNARDTISTERIRRHLEGEFLKRPDLKRVWDEVGRPLNKAITEMEFNGIYASKDVIRSLQTLTQAKIDEVKERLSKIPEVPPDFSPNSPLQVGKLLFEDLGLPNQGKTASGKQYVTSAGVLEAIEDRHPVVRDILDYRKAQHFKSQYADGMLLHIRDDGRIHPNFKVAGTETGRPSCEDPNLFNIPRGSSPEGKLCRDIFCASDDDHILFEADYSQIELRIAAMLSGDELMIDLFRQGVDFHLATAKMIAPMVNEDPTVITKEHPLRDRSKTINFGTLYGDPPAGLAAKLNISKKLAEQLQNAILGKFLKLKSFINDSLRASRLSGVSRTWWNGEPFRERSLYQIGDADGPMKDTAERSSWNTPIQGTAAEYTNASLGAIQQWIEDDCVPARLVLTVYDSILLEVRKSAIQEVGENVKRIMTGWPVLHGIPIEAEFKMGRSWGSLEKVKF